MDQVQRLPLARLSIGALEYPLDGGWLVTTVRPSGLRGWEVEVTAPSFFHIDPAVSYQLYAVVADGRSFVGVALLQKESISGGRSAHRFLGTGELGSGLRMPV